MSVKRRSTSPESPTQLAALAIRHMEAKRYRDAVEIYKQLLKLEPEKGWQSHLIVAYVKRSEALIAKKMFKEALMLLDNAERLGSVPPRPDLNFVCLLRSGQHGRVPAYFFRVESLLQAQCPSVFPFLQESVALLLLLNPAYAEDVPADSPWHGQLVAVGRAMQAYAQGKDDLLKQHLQAISHRSPFKSLRLILKSLVITDHPGEALQRLQSIPRASPWAALAHVASLRFLDFHDFAQGLSTLSAEQHAMAVALRGIEWQAWQSFHVFLGASPDRCLTSLLRWGDAGLLPPHILHQACCALVVAHPNLLPVVEKKQDLFSLIEKIRLRALAEEYGEGNPRRSNPHWQRMIDLLEQSHSPTEETTQRRIALIYRHMAGQVQKYSQKDADYPRYLEESLIHDPRGLSSHLDLMAWHKQRGHRTDYKRCLERAARLFPEESVLLHAAIQEALINQTYKKASLLAKRLLVLDPLHTDVRRVLLDAVLAQAGKQIRAGRLDLAEKELAEVEKVVLPDMAAGSVRIAQGFLHWLRHRKEQGHALLQEGVQNAGGGILGWLKAFRMAGIFNLPPLLSGRVRKELVTHATEKPTQASVLALVETMAGYVNDPPTRRGALLLPLKPFFEKGVRLSFTADELRSICHLFDQTNQYPLLTKYATRGVLLWKDQPIFVYYQVLAKSQRGDKAISWADSSALDRAAYQAMQMDDHETVRRIETLLGNEDEAWLFGDEDDDEDDEDDEDDFDFPDMDLASLRLPKAMEQMMIGALADVAREFWRNAHGSLVREQVRTWLREEILSKDVPLPMVRMGVFDAVLDKAMDRAGIPK